MVQSNDGGFSKVTKCQLKIDMFGWAFMQEWAAVNGIIVPHREVRPNVATLYKTDDPRVLRDQQGQVCALSKPRGSSGLLVPHVGQHWDSVMLLKSAICRLRAETRKTCLFSWASSLDT